MAKIQITVNIEDNIPDIISHLVLSASAIFDEKCPDAWSEPMTMLAAAIGKHIADNLETDTPHLRIVP